MRQLVLDTETTGLDPATGDRVIEIAVIEIVNLIPTGEAWHVLLDPERDVPPESTRIHGFTLEMLQGKLTANRLEITDSGDLVRFFEGVDMVMMLDNTAIPAPNLSKPKTGMQ